MLQLRIRQHALAEGRHRVEIDLTGDPKTDSPLALTVHSFVRAHPNAALAPRLPARESGKIRILLVLSRPRGDEDVPFRSVASQLIRGLSKANREAYDLDVLRPPTFEQLGKTLRQAHQEGQPYHVVHFDGHGDYLEIEEPGAARAGATLGEAVTLARKNLADALSAK